MTLAPEAPTEADAFHRSVDIAGLLAARGLPVAGARHAGYSLDVGFSTPTGAIGAVETPDDGAPDLPDHIEAQRAAGQGQDGWL